MINLRTPIRFRDALPSATDVVVIGGGVIGVFTALYLQRLGAKVTLCEKGRVAGEQSSRNWGWVRCMNRDPSELPLAMEAQRLWQECDLQVDGRTGLKIGEGIHYLCSTEKKLESWNFWIDIAKEHGLDSHFVSKNKIAEQFPALAHQQYAGALCTPTDGRAEPWTAVPAIAELAQNEGVIIRENCAVRGLEVEGGVVRGVVVEDDVAGGLSSMTVAADQVVLAGGAWSSMLARRHGVVLPQLHVQGTVVSTTKMNEVVSGQVKDESIAVRRRCDGGYTIALSNTIHHLGPESLRHAIPYLPLLGTMPDVSLRPPPSFNAPNNWFGSGGGFASSWSDEEISPFEKTRVLDPPPDSATVKKLQHLFLERFPTLCEGKIPEISSSWGGMIDAMPDVVPVVDRVAALDGLIVATGMSGHGFGIGPAFGKAVANIVMGQNIGHDMKRFRSDRFHDGSSMRPGPGL